MSTLFDSPSEPIDIKTKIENLRAELNRHTKLYYVEAKPEISDKEFDDMLRELRELELAHPEFYDPNSPTARVGGEVQEGFDEFRHIIPMQSLENTYAKGEIAEFDSMVKNITGLDNIEYIVEPKIDGLAFALHYKNGVFECAATRGNGAVGDDITQNVRTIKAIPMTIPTSAAWVEVRGEIFMPKKSFLDLVLEQESRGEEPFKNPRNAAAGSIKLLDPKIVASRKLSAVLYGAGRLDGIDDPQTHEDLTNMLKSFGLPSQPKIFKCNNLSEVYDAIDQLDHMRHDFPFEIDGAVIKVNNRSLYRTLGSTAKAPRWARAYKYAPEQIETVIEAITVQVGRLGYLTPVAELRTVRLSGSDISRATLHNADEIKRKDIRIGDHVMIEKAGEIIPAVVSVVTEARTGSEQIFHMPDTCPACGEPVYQEEGEVGIRCKNFLCPAQLLRRITHFASRDALNIEGLGDRVAQALVDQKAISSPLDLFEQDEDWLATLALKNYNSSIPLATNAVLFSNDSSDIDDFKSRFLGKTNAHTIKKSLERSKELPLSKWIYALGIPSIGYTTAQEIAKLHTSFEDFASSEIISSINRLYELMDEADEKNPKGRKMRDKGIEERVLAAEQFSIICDEIEKLATDLIKRKLATKSKTGNLKYTCVIKPEASKALKKFFSENTGKEIVSKMKLLGINPVNTVISQGNSDIYGKTFVLTGTLTAMGRTQAAKLIEKQGGKVSENVSSETDFLVIGEKPGATKTNRAKDLGVTIINEQDFLKMINYTPKEQAKPKINKQPEEIQGLLF